MRYAGYIILTFSLVLMGCTTPLTLSQRCALIGEVYEGSTVGYRTQVSSIGKSIVSYPVRTYQPRCRLPATEKELEVVEKLYPNAAALQKKNNRAYYGVLIGSLVFSTLIVLVAYSLNR